MNKFNINTPASSQPGNVNLIAADRVLYETAIAPSTTPLQMTINGIIVPRSP
jgi:hypothetical protein